MAQGGKSSAPGSVAEGLGNVLRAISDTMQAPDAVQFAGPLMKLQTMVLDQIHGGKGGGQHQGQQAPGAPAQGAAPPGGPPGGGAPSPMGGPPPGGGGLSGGLAGMMGAGQGPSQAVSGGGSSLSGMDPEQMRQDALVGADQ